ncbi:MAG: YeeE/YedE family protein [Cycloclasticus sp.]|nr:YeeE/YedE family protein [Cycloclasticus sp.]
MLKILSALVAGVVFGVGLALSQMVNPNKVINFLDITGQWDPSLMFVLGGAVLTTTVAYRFIFSKDKPVFDNDFQLPTLLKIDRQLLIGAVLFGAGWGVIGYCPGPVVASLGFGFEESLIVVISMLAGMLLCRAIIRR